MSAPKVGRQFEGYNKRCKWCNKCKPKSEFRRRILMCDACAKKRHKPLDLKGATEEGVEKQFSRS